MLRAADCSGSNRYLQECAKRRQATKIKRVPRQKNEMVPYSPTAKERRCRHVSSGKTTRGFD
eukprot:3812533-Karenia_brevis.AAC.1